MCHTHNIEPGLVSGLFGPLWAAHKCLFFSQSQNVGPTPFSPVGPSGTPPYSTQSAPCWPIVGPKKGPFCLVWAAHFQPTLWTCLLRPHQGITMWGPHFTTVAGPTGGPTVWIRFIPQRQFCLPIVAHSAARIPRPAPSQRSGLLIHLKFENRLRSFWPQDL